MAGLEFAGLALAAPAVVQQLLKTSVEGYRIFNDVKDCGKSIHRHQTKLTFEHLRFADWIQIIADHGGDLSALLDGGKYDLAIKVLVHIADVFANVENLEKKYGIQRHPSSSSARSLPMARVKDVTAESSSLRSGKRSKAGLGRLLSSAKSKLRGDKDKRSSQTQFTPSFSASSESSPSTVTYIGKEKLPSSTTVLRETVRDLSGSDMALVHVQQSLEVTLQKYKVEDIAIHFQATISTFRQYEWVLSARTQLERLVLDLKEYNDQLHYLISSLRTLKGAFPIPIECEVLTDVWTRDANFDLL